MNYIIVLLGVVSLLAVAAWLFASMRARPALPGAPPAAREPESTGSATARLLKGERHEDEPCLTPIDCVMTKRCAGHCGCH